MSLNIKIGDAVYPTGSENKIIAHICNNVGAWGGGFTKPLTRRWVQPKFNYRQLKKRELGSVQFISVELDITVANMIGQVFHHRQGPPIRYDAVRKALKTVAQEALRNEASIHMPRIGCGLAGGKWSEIEPIVYEELVNAGVHVYVYDLKV